MATRAEKASGGRSLPPVNNPSARKLARYLLEGGHHVDTAQTVVDAAATFQQAMQAGQAVFEVPLIDGSAALIFGPKVAAIVAKPQPQSVIEQ